MMGMDCSSRTRSQWSPAAPTGSSRATSLSGSVPPCGSPAEDGRRQA